MNNRIRQWVVRSWEIPVCGILLSLLFLLHITSLRHKGLTTDEPLHYQYGDRVLHSSPRRSGVLGQQHHAVFKSARHDEPIARYPCQHVGIFGGHVLGCTDQAGSVRDNYPFALSGIVRICLELPTVWPSRGAPLLKPLRVRS